MKKTLIYSTILLSILTACGQNSQISQSKSVVASETQVDLVDALARAIAYETRLQLEAGSTKIQQNSLSLAGAEGINYNMNLPNLSNVTDAMPAPVKDMVNYFGQPGAIDDFKTKVGRYAADSVDPNIMRTMDKYDITPHADVDVWGRSAEIGFEIRF